MSPRPHHRHHGRRFGRGGRTYIIGTPYDDLVVDCLRDIDGVCVSEIDAKGCCDAGDLLPTSPQQLRTAVFAEDQNWEILNRQIVAGIMASKISVPFANAFTDKHAGWKYFYVTIMTDTPFNTAAVEQLQSWMAERSKWAKEIEALTGKSIPGPISDPPPVPTNPTLDVTKLALVLGGVATLVIFGPKLAKLF